MNSRFSKLVQKFLTSYLIGECNYSQNTKKSYSTTLLLFVNFMEKEKKIKANKIEIESITKETVIQFLNWLETLRNVSISTRNQRLACLKSFYKYVLSNEIDLFDNCSSILSIKNKKTPSRIISYFTEDEIKMMIKYLNDNKNLKRLTMFCVLYETGARVSEFINIKIADLNLRENANIILYGKGNKVRAVPISEELVKLIGKYLNDAYINYGENYLFYSSYKKKYTRQSINFMIKTLVFELKEIYPNNFKGCYHPHSFRHTKATHLYNNGTSLLNVKEFLGHSSLTSTEIYATPNIKKQREEILKNSESLNVKNRYSNVKKETLDNWLKTNMR